MTRLNIFLRFLVLVFIMMGGVGTFIFANNLPLSVFSLKNYPQQTEVWFNKKSINYDIHQRLLSDSYQNQRLTQLKQHYFGIKIGDSSPWAAEYVKKLIKSRQHDILVEQSSAIRTFTNLSLNPNGVNNNIGFGINYLPYLPSWSQQIATNMDLEQLQQIVYSSSNRAIAVDNLAARVIPTHEPWFLNHNIAGEGYPFDYIQESKIDIGTPLYILGATKDQQWLLVLTPYLIAWVEASGVARASETFIYTWNKYVAKNIVVITKPDTTLVDNKNNILGVAYVAAVFPLFRNLSLSVSVDKMLYSNKYQIMVPIKNHKTNSADFMVIDVDKDSSALMPLPATIYNFTELIGSLKGRPYSWGGQYNYNDCSAEMQNIFIPLGYFMPRNSEQQLTAGKVVDLSQATPQERLDYLLKYGEPLLTLIYIKGHIMLYIGDTYYYGNKLTPMTYQNLWGFSPLDRSHRYIVGQAVFMPLLLKFSENININSLVNGGTFKLVFLNTGLTQFDGGY